METVQYQGFECVQLSNEHLTLLVTQSVGPRVISLSFNGGDNLLAVLPDFVTERPDGELFHFYGGHRLWHAPEGMPRTYHLDNEPVDITPTDTGLLITQKVEPQTGIEKSIHIALADDQPQVTIRHTLTNQGLWPVECAPFKPGGVAILPQSREPREFLPNRALAIWTYSDIASPHVTWGNDCILYRAEMQEGAFKIGFPNPHGWLAYWLDGILFVKRATYDPKTRYYDHGSSSECYCNEQFLELETLAPVSTIPPGSSVTHIETWELYADVGRPINESAAQKLVDTLGLE